LHALSSSFFFLNLSKRITYVPILKDNVLCSTCIVSGLKVNDEKVEPDPDYEYPDYSGEMEYTEMNVPPNQLQ